MVREHAPVFTSKLQESPTQLSVIFGLVLSQADPGTAAVLVDELDAGGYKSSLNNLESGPARLTQPCLKLMHCHNADACTACQFLLAPLNQAPCCSTLCWCHHGQCLPKEMILTIP